MRDTHAEILTNERIAQDIYRMELKAQEIVKICEAGQFVNLYTGDPSAILPRPISICAANKGTGVLTLVYRVAGKGTAMFSRMIRGESLRVLGPIGTGFPVKSGNIALVGGGIGIPPLLELASVLREADSFCKITAFLGFRDSDTFLLDEFNNACDEVKIATDDGSVEFHGNCAERLKECSCTYDWYYACGPTPMLRALKAMCPADRTYLSLEERMGCGMGACLGCAVKIGSEDSWVYKRVCKDGPVFLADEIIF